MPLGQPNNNLFWYQTSCLLHNQLLNKMSCYRLVPALNALLQWSKQEPLVLLKARRVPADNAPNTCLNYEPFLFYNLCLYLFTGSFNNKGAPKPMNIYSFLIKGRLRVSVTELSNRISVIPCPVFPLFKVVWLPVFHARRRIKEIGISCLYII